MPRLTAKKRMKAALFLATPYAGAAILCSIIITGIHSTNGVPVTAQLTDDTDSATGDTIGQTLRSFQEQAAQLEWEARLQRSQQFRSDLQNEKTAFAALERHREQLQNRQTEHRAACAEEMRRANKFTKLPTALRCYAAELGLENDLLRKERAYLEVMAGISPESRSLALTRLDLLADAIQTITTAIESKVFQATEELEEAKGNLLQTYRQPYWLVRKQLQVERMQTWTASLMTRMAGIASEQEDGADTVQELMDVLYCLQQSETLLGGAALLQENDALHRALEQAEEHIRNCMSILSQSLPS